MLTWIAMLGVAMAGPQEDLVLASSKTASEADRMAAFERLVALGSTDMELVSRVSQDDAADARYALLHKGDCDRTRKRIEDGLCQARCYCARDIIG